MTDIPIIFSAPMVLALQCGRKTMTRRMLYTVRRFNGDMPPDSFTYLQGHPPPKLRVDDGIGPREAYAISDWHKAKPGDRLWVRETHFRWGGWIGTKRSGNPTYRFKGIKPSEHFEPICYGDEPPGGALPFAAKGPGWVKRPAIFHCREHSRLTLVVTATKVEQLQKISEADAAAEGVQGLYEDRFDPPRFNPMNWRRFMFLWADLHGFDSWESNPEVVALTFTVHQQNIDSLKEAA